VHRDAERDNQKVHEPPFWADVDSVVITTLVVQIWPFGALMG